MSLKALFPPRWDWQPGKEIVSMCLREFPYLALQDALGALVAFTVARRSAGKFVLQLDDTDPEPLSSGNLNHILNMLSWLDLSPDEFDDLGQYGPYSWRERRQLEYKDLKLDIYQEIVTSLIDQGWAYLCFCQPMHGQSPPGFFNSSSAYKQHCREMSPDEIEHRLCMGQTHLVRFRVPNHRKLEYMDPVYGLHYFETDLMEDFPLLTPDGMPMPYFAYVVDNHFMQATVQVRRQSDLSIVPHEILLSKALGWDLPTWIHLPSIHDPTAQSLFEELRVDQFHQQGYLPQTILNFLAELIWTHPEGKAVYPYADFQQGFEISQIPCKELRLDYELLSHIQRSYTMNKL